MGQIYFISGIDTNVGKSVATGLMARYLVDRKPGKIITAKLVQTGNVGSSEDILVHRKMMGVPSFPEDAEGLTAPQIFPFPASPHLAAKLVGKTVDTAKIAKSVETLASRYETVLVEGAGGLMVPLSENLLTIDFVKTQRWPIILVSDGRLGSINHTLLSLEACATRYLRVAGLVYNRFVHEDSTIAQETRRIAGVYMGLYGFRPETVVEMPLLSKGKTTGVDFSPIFGC